MSSRHRWPPFFDVGMGMKRCQDGFPNDVRIIV
jgi:hypothetical protein